MSIHSGATSSVHDICSDIWQQIFQYFQPAELTSTFAHVTTAADRVLFDENEHFCFRGHTIDENRTDLPINNLPGRVMSLALHNGSYLRSIEQYSELRSLKLIGVEEWIVPLMKQIASRRTKLEQLTAEMPSTKSLSQLLISVLSVSTLRRLELDVDDLESSGRICDSNIASRNVEQFIFRSASSFDCNDFLCMLPHFASTHLLDISLIIGNPKTVSLFSFNDLRTLRLGLLEVSFNWIVQLMTTVPCLVKLQLTGLVDNDGFVIDEKWTHLFQSAPTLTTILVRLSLEQVDECFCCEKLHARLLALNLRLVCNDDDNDCFQHYGSEHRWWNLKGTITKPYGSF